MLQVITSESDIKYYQIQFEQLLESYLPNHEEYFIGYPGGRKRLEVYSNSDIWFSHSTAGINNPRFWNAFGLSRNLTYKKSNSIVTEINFLQKGVNGQVAGTFVKDDKTNKVYIAHSGKIGGGKKGIGKTTFLRWYKTPTQEIFKASKKYSKSIIIGDIESETILKDLSRFIKSVDNFKKLVSNGDINEVTLLTEKELEAKINSTVPQKKKSKASANERNKYIAELTKRRALGVCQLCTKKAPFKNKLGKPYLESHHIIWLSKGGADSLGNCVAVCPNCHKKLHILDLKSDVKKLTKIKHLTNRPT
jgi:5-methylcytosine-specific restriction protein A